MIAENDICDHLAHDEENGTVVENVRDKCTVLHGEHSPDVEKYLQYTGYRNPQQYSTLTNNSVASRALMLALVKCGELINPRTSPKAFSPALCMAPSLMYFSSSNSV